MDAALSGGGIANVQNTVASEVRDAGNSEQAAPEVPGIDVGTVEIGKKVPGGGDLIEENPGNARET